MSEKTVYAFDRNGTLNQEPIRQLARDLLAAGHEVHVVSHLPKSSPERDALAREQISRMGIPFTSIHASDYSTGKSPVMQKVGASILLDDSPAFVLEAERAGLQAIGVMHPTALLPWMGRKLGLETAAK